MRRRRFLQQRPFAQRGSTKDKKSAAVQLRGDPTRAELVLWQSLRKRRLGSRFRRQQIIAGYVVDFYCPTLQLAIELDGGVHGERRHYDDQRDLELAALGVVVLRFDNADVLERLLWEETSRNTRPSHARSVFGRRAFASSLASALQVAQTW